VCSRAVCTDLREDRWRTGNGQTRDVEVVEGRERSDGGRSGSSGREILVSFLVWSGAQDAGKSNTETTR
jgi:hypothetical protein